MAVIVGLSNDLGQEKVHCTAAAYPKSTITVGWANRKQSLRVGKVPDALAVTVKLPAKSQLQFRFVHSFESG
jgi:hypothetical protein